MPLFFLFHTVFGMEGMFFASPAADGTATLLSAVLLIKELKKLCGAATPFPTAEEQKAA